MPTSALRPSGRAAAALLGFVAGIAATLISQIAVLNLTSIKEARQLAAELVPEVQQNLDFVKMISKIAADWRRTGNVLDVSGRPVAKGLDFSRMLGRRMDRSAYDRAHGRLGALPPETVSALKAFYSDLGVVQDVIDRKAEWERDRDFMFQRSLEFSEVAGRTATSAGLLTQLQRVAAGGHLRYFVP